MADRLLYRSNFRNAGDENGHLLMGKNLKTASTVSISSAGLGGPVGCIANVTNTNMLSLQSFSSTSNVFASATTTTTTTTTTASLRNALGDIGNRIQASQQFGGIAVLGKKELKSAAPLAEKIACTAEAKVEPTQPPASNELNDSSIMEVSSDIQDIDEPDADNPQLVSEYAKDIYNYLNQMERRFRVSPNFLERKIVTAKMRSVLIDWLIQVHLKFHLLQETLYLCVQIIDAYLQAQDVPKMQLQLVGVTAMFLASKYEEMYVPAIEDFVYMTDNTYSKAEIRQMEISILKTLDFMFGKPLPLHFLRRFSKAGQADPKQHTLAKYFMELSLHEAEFASLDPSYLAACSLCLSFKLLDGVEWNRTLEYYSTYNQSVLWSGMQKIARLVIKSSELDYKYRAATNKYGASKFMRVTLLPELGSDYMRQLAVGKIPS